MPNYFDISPVVFGEDFFSFWLPWQPKFCMEWKSLYNFERGPPKNIPVKFGEISSGLGEDVIKRKLLMLII